ncbi:MAG: TetR-like C-terminal domain-containing protein [Solirubrobacteraceae bacterium]|nr:TetR-like C-terminal domain-containing protein [Solirubrobacteraceae bacterium]
MRASIIGATLEEIVRVGFVDLSMARVAAKAEVALTTVHRRWGTKAALAADAIVDHLAGPAAVPDLGSLEADLRAIAELTVGALRDETIKALLRATMLLQSPELDQVRLRLDALADELATPIVGRAIARGELPEGTAPQAALELLVAGLWMRSFVSGGRLDERDLESFVADAMAALGRELVR